LPIIAIYPHCRCPAPSSTMLAPCFRWCRRHCDLAALRPCGIATWRHCDLAALRPGGIATWRHCGHAIAG
jgi:hypothetical protein